MSPSAQLTSEQLKEIIASVKCILVTGSLQECLRGGGV